MGWARWGSVVDNVDDNNQLQRLIGRRLGCDGIFDGGDDVDDENEDGKQG